MSVPGPGAHLPPASRKVLEAIADDVAALAGVPVVAIWSADEETRTLTVTVVAGQAGSLSLATLPYGVGGIGWVVANRTALEVADVFADPRFIGHDWRRSHGLTSFCAVPLVLDERLLGVLVLDGRAPIELTATQRGRLADLATRATGVLDDASWVADAHRRHEELAGSRAQLAARVREMAALIAVADVMGTTTDPVEALRLICRQLGRLTGADTVAAFQLDHERSEAYPVAGYHVPATVLTGLTGARLALAEVRFSRTLLNEQQVVWSDDAPHDARFTNSFFARFPHRSCALIPLTVDDEMSGVLHLVWWTRPRRFDEHEVALLQAIGHQASVIMRNARLLGLRAVTRLANAAAHEINNPLAVVLGQLQLLAREMESAGRHRLDAALAATDRIQDIVRRLTRITRLEDLDRRQGLPPALDLRRSSEEDAGPHTSRQ